MPAGVKKMKAIAAREDFKVGDKVKDFGFPGNAVGVIQAIKGNKYVVKFPDGTFELDKSRLVITRENLWKIKCPNCGANFSTNLRNNGRIVCPYCGYDKIARPDYKKLVEREMMEYAVNGFKEKINNYNKKEVEDLLKKMLSKLSDGGKFAKSTDIDNFLNSIENGNNIEIPFNDRIYFTQKYKYKFGEKYGLGKKKSPAKRRWVFHPSEGSCESCRALNGQVRAVGEKFTDPKGKFKPVDSPPLHKNCNCKLESVN